MADIKQLEDPEFQKGIEKGVTLVDFYANWCGPCRTLAPVLEQVAKDVEGKAIVAKVDIDNAQNTANAFQISSVPTMILFKDGEEVGRLIGLKSADAIKEFIETAK